MTGAVLMPAATEGLALLASTGAEGYTLQDATGTILQWTAPGAPGDGNLHRVLLLANLVVSSGETGGAIGFTNLTAPNGSTHSPGVSAGGAGVTLVQYTQSYMVESGSTVTLAQTSALTGGAAVFWAELWGS